MNRRARAWIVTGLLSTFSLTPGQAETAVYEVTTAYHHIRVADNAGMRLLYFDDAPQSQVSLQNPLQGHFEYTEYFHMPWLWNTQLNNVLIIGLGGGTTQTAFAHYYPQVNVDTAELDPMVLEVARQYFNFKESQRQKVHIADGRMFLRRAQSKYDLIILDAYVRSRYGACIPQHLVTKEFFELAREHLNPTNGIIAYNVIGNIDGWHANIVGATYRTLKFVFPQVYLFPCQSSQNVVLLATTAKIKVDISMLRQRAYLLMQNGRIALPGFMQRLERFRSQPPASYIGCPILTDDYAPVEGLAAEGGR